jgi:hypothetical protein
MICAIALAYMALGIGGGCPKNNRPDLLDRVELLERPAITTEESPNSGLMLAPLLSEQPRLRRR